MHERTERDERMRIPLMVRVLLSLCGALLIVAFGGSKVAASDPIGSLGEATGRGPLDEVIGVLPEAADEPVDTVVQTVDPIVESAEPVRQLIEPVEPILPPITDTLEPVLPAIPSPAGGAPAPAAERPAVAGILPIDLAAEASGGHPLGGDLSTSVVADRVVQRVATVPSASASGAVTTLADGGGPLDTWRAMPAAADAVVDAGGIGLASVIVAGLALLIIMGWIGRAMADPTRLAGLTLAPPVPPG